ncbi:MAG: helix-turn-helix domain-containing protein [Coriobacteriaceae bacterium]|nr:helix-turn-helix domain-containing protein [Olsenella sp.]RRF89153.1 MAG: helix-turn-helix domain-containing protein [Coriobacteriaceae bacterium]
MKEEYTVKEIADLLGVSQVSIRRKIQSGEIKPQPTPRGKDPNKATKKVGASDLLDYLKKHPSQIAAITSGTVMVAAGGALSGVALEVMLSSLIGVIAALPSRAKVDADDLRVSSQELRRIVERKREEQREQLDALQSEIDDLEKRLDEVDTTILRCNWVIDQLDSVAGEGVLVGPEGGECASDADAASAIAKIAKALTTATDPKPDEQVQKPEKEEGV